MGMSKSKIFLGVIAVLAVFTFGYKTADNLWERKYLEFKLNAEKEYSALLESKIEADQVNRQRINAVETKYTKELNEQKAVYEKTIANLRDNFTPSGVFDCTSSGECMPRTSGSTSEFVCYRTTDLQQRIARSLAIGYRADQLAIKYNTLLKIVKGENE